MTLEGKKVLATGADGFIGSHLVEALVGEGCRARAFVCYNSFNSWGWIDTFSGDLTSHIEVFPGDVRDFGSIRKAVEGVDVVFHLAALIGIPYSYRNPESYVETNIGGTLNVLQAVVDEGCEKVLVTSTSEVYGTARYVPIDEKHPLQGQSPYSATKIGADKVAESFFRSFGTPVTIVRPFNTYGPRQSARAVIPTVIIQLLSGRKKVNLGSLSPTRDFNYVKDTVSGFIAIAESDSTNGEELNLATQEEVSIGEVARRIIGQIEPGATVDTEEVRIRPAQSEVNRLVGSNEKVRRLTSWEPRYDLDSGLRETIEWFRDNHRLPCYKADIYNV
jgi:NAD dependent epimerase/dehydratase